MKVGECYICGRRTNLAQISVGRAWICAGCSDAWDLCTDPDWVREDGAGESRPTPPVIDPKATPRIPHGAWGTYGDEGGI